MLSYEGKLKSENVEDGAIKSHLLSHKAAVNLCLKAAPSLTCSSLALGGIAPSPAALCAPGPAFPTCFLFGGAEAAGCVVGNVLLELWVWDGCPRSC